jgi:hypothetical protein
MTRTSDRVCEHYQNAPWQEIPNNMRRVIMRSRLEKPDTCPTCGRTSVYLFNKSGKYREDVNDYEWSCRVCHDKHPDWFGPDRAVKPWCDLTFESKQLRIKKHLPRPACCQHCSDTLLELWSLSGKNLEDITDWAWTCRSCRASPMRFYYESA